jgi:hypothetical protein
MNGTTNSVFIEKTITGGAGLQAGAGAPGCAGWGAMRAKVCRAVTLPAFVLRSRGCPVCGWCGAPIFWLCFVIFMGCCAGLCRIVLGCAGGVGREGILKFGRTKPPCAFVAGRIFGLPLWRHIGCSRYQESTGRGGWDGQVAQAVEGLG